VWSDDMLTSSPPPSLPPLTLKVKKVTINYWIVGAIFPFYNNNLVVSGIAIYLAVSIQVIGRLIMRVVIH